MIKLFLSLLLCASTNLLPYVYSKQQHKQVYAIQLDSLKVFNPNELKKPSFLFEKYLIAWEFDSVNLSRVFQQDKRMLSDYFTYSHQQNLQLFTTKFKEYKKGDLLAKLEKVAQKEGSMRMIYFLNFQPLFDSFEACKKSINPNQEYISLFRLAEPVKLYSQSAGDSVYVQFVRIYTEWKRAKKRD